MSSTDPTSNLIMGTAPEPVARRVSSAAVQEPRSYVAQVVADTVARWGARAGLLWVGLLAVLAVFAPFLANSHPILLQQGDGRWSSPLLQTLRPTDVLLLVAFFAALLLAALGRSLSFRTRAAMWVWIVAVTAPLAWWPGVRYDRAMWIQDWGRTLVWGALLVGGAIDAAAIVLVPVLLGVSRKVWAAILLPVVVLAGVLIAHPVRPPVAVVYERYRDMARAGQVRYALHTPVPYSPGDRLRDQPQLRLTGPTAQHWMGTELNGADVLSRMVHATRIALAIGFIATGIALVIGCVVGGVMGYFVGTLDILGMRLIEIFESVPTLFLLITFVAFFGRNLYLMMVIIGITSWSGYARFIRAEFLKLRHQDFVAAAIATGLPLRSVLFRHMLPNGITPVLVSASFGVASAILAEATLSFLGLGLVDEPSWGQLLNQATGQGGAFQWWLAVYPGLAIFLTVFAYNLVGEALRDALDPRLRGIE